MTSSERRNSLLQYGFLTITIAVVGVFFIVMLNRTYPVIGHDYTYFVSRIFDTYLHYVVNGPSIQWHTPSFGGGLPAYANPQHIQFSLVQLLTLFFDPWISIQISILVYIAAGVFCFFIFATQCLNLDWRASLLGALFFVLTGFYIGHMTSGQLGFMGFPIFSGIILALFLKGWSDWLAGSVIGLLAVSLTYQAGFYTLIIFTLSASITLPLLYVRSSHLFSFPSLIKRLTIAGFFFTTISLSKLYAVYTFMRFFPREIAFEYSNEYASSAIFPLLFFFTQVLGTTTLAPLMAITGQDVNSLPNLLSNLSGYPYSGLWETDNGLSPALIVTLVAALLMHLLARKKIDFTGLSKDRLLALLIGLAATWFTLEYMLARGWLYSLAIQLPVLKSLHIHFRFTAAFYFPLAVTGALILHNWLNTSTLQRANTFFVGFTLLTLLSPLSYFMYSEDVHYRMFNVTGLIDAYAQSKQGEIFPVTSVSDEKVRDWEAIPRGVTTLKPYEPVFGYGNPDFPARIHPGPVSEPNDGFFNLTNPASLTFPESNGGELFSLFTVEDRERMEQFIQRRQPVWMIPGTQILLNAISASAVIIALAIVIVNLWLMTKSTQIPSTP